MKRCRQATVSRRYVCCVWEIYWRMTIIARLLKKRQAAWGTNRNGRVSTTVCWRRCALIFIATIIILCGDSSLMAGWRQEWAGRYLPDQACFAIPDSAHVPAVVRKPAPEQGVTATVCVGAVCRAAISSKADFVRYLDACPLPDNFCSIRRCAGQ